MPIELALGQGLLDALKVDEPERRREAVGEWIATSPPQIEKALRQELLAYVEELDAIAANKRPPTKWINQRWLMSVQVKMVDQNAILEERLNNEKSQAKLRKLEGIAKPPATRGANSPQPSPPNGPPSASAGTSDDDDYDGGGSSSNDDRSDSMNPNNDSYQASMDNHSNQMNPNNDAYWSSRGR